MNVKELSTKAEITWCPGCTNYGILSAAKRAIVELVNNKKIDVKKVTIVTGIGCHAKIYDYLNVNGFYGIHGRVLPIAFGIKLANPELTVIGFGGDGDTYAEGVSHFVHACRYNADMVMIVHNNQVFSLTTGQMTPTSEVGYKGRSTPLGVKEKPLNPVALALINGATFVARGFALDVRHLTKLIEEAIEHKGFAFIDTLQPCLIYHDTSAYFKEHIYKLEETGHDTSNYEDALKRALEWDYCLNENVKIPIGVFYKVKKPTYGEQWPQLRKPFYMVKRKVNWEHVISEFR